MKSGPNYGDSLASLKWNYDAKSAHEFKWLKTRFQGLFLGSNWRAFEVSWGFFLSPFEGGFGDFSKQLDSTSKRKIQKVEGGSSEAQNVTLVAQPLL